MRHIAAALLAATLASATACSAGGDGGRPDAKRPAVTASPSETAYTKDDCTALLEKNFVDDNIHDASREEECRNLSRAEYQDSAKTVLLRHADEVRAKARDQVEYGEVWDALGKETQESTCDLLYDQGPLDVGKALEPVVDDPTIDTEKMAEYFYMEKC
ncbi:hypothetical protein [Streptomyces sp. NPDC002692]